MKQFVLQLTDVTGPLRFVPYELVAAAAMLLFGAVVVFGFVLPVAGITSWLERRV